MKTWKNKIIDKFDDLIDEIIAEINDNYTDEILCDMVQDPEYRQEAYEYLLDLIEKELGYVTN